MRKFSAVFGVVTALCLGNVGFAQPIVVEVGGSSYGTFADGADISIDLTSISPISGALLVRIYDSQSGAPQHSVGKVTITGRASNGATLQVLVAPPSQSAFPSNPALPFDPGAIDLGGNSSGGIIIQPDAGHASDTSLRDAARIAVAISGDAYGTIDGAQIFTFQAFGRNSTGSPVQLLGGNIYANLTARGIDDTDQTGFFKAIPYIQAGSSIQGSIQATGVAATASPGSIQLVIVGATNGNDAHASSPQITGDILAPLGTIEQIWCTGPIGTQSHTATITAGTHIGLITTRDKGVTQTNDTTDVKVANFYANVNASALSSQVNPTTSVSLIETGGNFVGDLHVYNFNADYGEFARHSTRMGIFVGGDYHGNISSTFDWFSGAMIARNLYGTITIGRMLEGVIVAVGNNGQSDGIIDSVDIGNGTATDSNVPLQNAGHGFNASGGPIIHTPFEGASRDVWYTRTPMEYMDSDIRAATSIGSINIKNMGSNLYNGVSTKPYRPRIESPYIGSLSIQSFESGVVWSGILGNGFNPPTTPDDITDDYTAVGTQNDGALSIGCVGPRADLWVHQCILVDVLGDMFGEIHVPELAAYEVVRIRGKLGDIGQVTDDYSNPDHYALTCTGELRYTGDSITAEKSPRGFWSEIEDNHGTGTPGFAVYGRILVRRPHGLRGQVILDEMNTGVPRPGDDHPCEWLGQGDGYMRGDVEIGTGDSTGTGEGDLNTTGNPWVISRCEDRAMDPVGQSDKAWMKNDIGRPEYRIAYEFSGSGAVGMVPFGIDHTNSIPNSDCVYDDGCNRSPGPNYTIPFIGVNDFIDTGLLPIFLGPVLLGGSQDPLAQHLSMYACYPTGVPNTSHDYGADGTIAVSVPPIAAAPFTRVVKVKLVNDDQHLRGRFILMRHDNGLLCDMIRNTMHVDDFAYNFWIGDGGGTEEGICCDGDFNCDGDVGTDADIESFFACLAQNCPPCRPNGADFNCDGDVGTDADIEAFFRVLAGGSC
jgi:hypothetical protein